MYICSAFQFLNMSLRNILLLGFKFVKKADNIWEILTNFAQICTELKTRKGLARISDPIEKKDKIELCEEI